MAAERDDALRWAGDEDPTLVSGEDLEPEHGDAATAQLAPGWTPVGEAGRYEPAPAEAEAEGAAVDDGPRPIGSVALVGFGVLGGIYLLYTIGWVIVATRIGSGSGGVLDQAMFTLGAWLTVLTPAGWFALTLGQTRSKPRARILWLVIGAVVLAPVPLLYGTGVAGA